MNTKTSEALLKEEAEQAKQEAIGQETLKRNRETRARAIQQEPYIRIYDGPSTETTCQIEA